MPIFSFDKLGLGGIGLVMANPFKSWLQKLFGRTSCQRRAAELSSCMSPKQMQINVNWISITKTLAECRNAVCFYDEAETTNYVPSPQHLERFQVHLLKFLYDQAGSDEVYLSPKEPLVPLVWFDRTITKYLKMQKEAGDAVNVPKSLVVGEDKAVDHYIDYLLDKPYLTIGCRRPPASRMPPPPGHEM